MASIIQCPVNKTGAPLGTSLVVQRLRLYTPNAGGLSLILGQGTRSPILQIRPSVAKLINKKTGAHLIQLERE